MMTFSRFAARVSRRSFLSSRRSFSQTDDILDKLRVIIDPDLKKDIVSLEFVKNLQITGTRVSFDLELTTPACPIKDKFHDSAVQVVKELPWVEHVDVNMTARGKTSHRAGELGQISNIIAVASCKGGVGKSSISVNLSYMLQEMGAKVGILDADIYGPSLPFMVKPKDPRVYGTKDGGIIPIEYEGVKLMSMGFLRNQAAAIRGPMVSAMAQQMLTQTKWGPLDYLIIDMPPGTGDIHLTISQNAHIDAAVVVTTPQRLSLVDVEKGINMFNTVQIPTLALVENMSYFSCPHCNERSDIFNRGAGQNLAKQFGLEEQYYRVPIDPKLSESDEPYVLRNDENNIAWQGLKDLAMGVVRALSTMKANRGKLPKVSAEDGHIVMRKEDAEFRIDDRELRLECRSAVMRHEFTGEKIFDEKKIPMDVHPTQIDPCGAYAVRIDWSDGHHSIFSFKLLDELLR